MIERVSGTVLSVEPAAVVIDLHGLGVRVDVTGPTAERLPAPGGKATLFTQLHVNGNDGSLRLFGFRSAEERALFRLLMGVAGIGPQNALSLTGSRAEPGEVAALIGRGDPKALKVKGVGPKLAQRVVTELHDKLGALGSSGALPRPVVAAPAAPVAGPLEDALQALRALEFDPEEARRLLDLATRHHPEARTADELLRAALMRS